jgi:hypothetical protein
MSSINIRRVSSSSTSSSKRSFFGRNGWEPAAARMRPSGGADMSRLQYVQYVYVYGRKTDIPICTLRYFGNYRKPSLNSMTRRETTQKIRRSARMTRPGTLTSEVYVVQVKKKKTFV